MEEINWREIAGEILERVCRSLDYYCHRVSGDTLEDCYAAHYDLPLYTIAELLEGLGFEGVSKEDLELLGKMPEEVYKEIEAELRRRIETVLDNLRFGEE
jgi:hypothetical protein